VLLAVAAGISTIIMLQNREPESASSQQPSFGIAYFLKAAEMRGTGPDGNVLYRLTAERAEQLSDTAHIDLTNIALSYEPSAQVPWDLFADKGKIPPDGKLVELQGNVVILSKDPETPQTSIRTNRIDFLPGERLARTNQKVVIVRDGKKINGIGMEAYLDTSEIKLLSNVNGKYVQ
jgi:LPS export ABC transporter protein LptC